MKALREDTHKKGIFKVVGPQRGEGGGVKLPNHKAKKTLFEYDS